MKDKSLALTAKNVKIVTADGKVALRGPVNTEDEKTKINYIAKTAAGKVPVGRPTRSQSRQVSQSNKPQKQNYHV